MLWLERLSEKCSDDFGFFDQTFTEKVNMTVGRKIAKTIGYKQVEKNNRPMFKGLRTEPGR